MATEELLCIALETSARAGSVALRLGMEGQTVVRQLDETRSHGSDLIPAIDQLVRDAGRTPRDIGLVAIGIGPGSYTGLRVGAATGLGLARGVGAELIGVPAFEAIAHGELQVGESAVLVRGAFGGQVYLAAYERTDGGLDERIAPLCCTFAEASARAAEGFSADGEQPTMWLGDERAAESLQGIVQGVIRAVRTPIDHLLDVALIRRATGAPTGPESVKPMYLRPFEAKNRRR